MCFLANTQLCVCVCVCAHREHTDENDNNPVSAVHPLNVALYAACCQVPFILHGVSQQSVTGRLFHCGASN